MTGPIPTSWCTPPGAGAGRGTALLQHAAGRAARARRTVLDLQTREGSSGVAFAGTFKARRSIASVRRVLALDRVPAGRAGLRAGAEAAAHGYTLRSWSGPTPEDAVAGVASVNAALADAPRADGEEEQVWDVARVRLDERRVAAMGLRPRVIAACAKATGELAALTQLCIDPGAPSGVSRSSPWWPGRIAGTASGCCSSWPCWTWWPGRNRS